MKTIKIIDLLNKIANGEAPRTIFYMGATYDYDKDCMDYEDVDTGDLMFDDRYNTQILNDFVEIPDEEDEFEDIEEIKSNGEEFYSDYIETWIKKEYYDAYCEYLMNKINDLIKNQKKIIEGLKDGE